MRRHLPSASKVVDVAAPLPRVIETLLDLDRVAVALGAHAELVDRTHDVVTHGSRWTEHRRHAGTTVSRDVAVDAVTPTGYTATCTVGKDRLRYSLRYTVTRTAEGSRLLGAFEPIGVLEPSSADDPGARPRHPENVFCHLLADDLSAIAHAAAGPTAED
ncbi:hypothetical protein ICW40_03255 [Actinotalea ferrariae]|uniref:hypothetical protein n=1 Tax=Actinotalea ferrariae TaxID=1386098 RepID=UPI001C8BC185|nr:hypothetical protein [Actinotalea ferrariae]MBX9243822.1 hypothetical protein [Actinotalea ferrariae]